MTVRTLADFLPFSLQPGHVAVIEHSPFRRRVYRYSEMQRGLENAMSSLQELGIGEGDKVVLWGENSARWMMTFYACLLLKIVVVPVDASFSEQFVNRIFVLTRAKLMCSDGNGSQWNQLFAERKNRPVIPTNTASNDTLLEIIFTSGTTGEPKGVLITHGNLLANLIPIYEEYQRYRNYATPF